MIKTILESLDSLMGNKNEKICSYENYSYFITHWQKGIWMKFYQEQLKKK